MRSGPYAGFLHSGELVIGQESGSVLPPKEAADAVIGKDLNTGAAVRTSAGPLVPGLQSLEHGETGARGGEGDRP